MAVIYDKDTTPYLTPRVEFDQLKRENRGDLVFGANVGAVQTGVTPQYFTTGNGLVYLQGSLFISGNPLTLNDVVITVPEEVKSNHTAQNYLFTVGGQIIGNVSETFSVSLEGRNLVVKDAAGIATGSSLFLNGLVYFTD